MCERLEKNIGQTVNIYNFVNLAALDNICETAMGINMNAQRNSETSYVRAVKEVCLALSMRFFKAWLMFDVIYYRTKWAEMQNRALDLLHGTADRVIKERRSAFAEKQKKQEQNPAADEYYEKKKLAFLDLLIESADGSKLSDEDIREEVETFMFEGHDTVSSGLGFCLYCLANHPDIQEKAYEEQYEIFGDSDRAPTNRDLNEMKYLERVIKEAQRLFPSVPLIGREIMEEMNLPDGYVVPVGTQLFIMIYALHRDPEVWGPEPEKFNPDNFTPEASVKRNPYAYVPFSAGARNCIGQKFAMMEMKATISKVLRRFRLKPSPYEKDKISLAAELVLISTTGYHVNIESRH